MDNSRIADIVRFQKVIDNPRKPKAVRDSAARARANIIRQMGDRKLVGMRNRLMGAALAEDELEEWRISNQIKDYMHEARVDKYT